MNVSIIGTGYVGLTTGVTLAYLGHEVTCIDVDPGKVDSLRAGKPPFFEPHLEELLAVARQRIRFTTAYAEAIPRAEVVIIAVGTPSLADGNPDLRYLKQAAEATGQHLDGAFTVVVNKSTVPIGSGNWVEALIRDAYRERNGRLSEDRFAVASNPEFLREGSALHDSLYPDRVVIGADRSRAIEVLYNLYKPILEQTFAAPPFLDRPSGLAAVPLVTADLSSAELIKYSANAFLALKISFINEIAQLAERVGADVTQVARGIGLDARIGIRFLQAGIGWGGSCFGKDTSALIATAGEYGLPMPIIEAARQVNQRQRERVVELLLSELKILKGRTVGLLGLAFKPDTDDLRDAPALDIGRLLAERGAKVRAHDPVALAKARQHFPDIGVGYCDDVEETVNEADALVLVTEWPGYRKLDWPRIAAAMRHKVLIDGRNYLDREEITSAGLRYIGIGR